MVRTIFAQPDAATVHEQHARIVARLKSRFPEAAALLDEAGPDLLAFTGFPKEHWQQLWSTDEDVKGADGVDGAVVGDFRRWIGRDECSPGLRAAPGASISRAARVFRRAGALLG